ncbi:DUF418 domain-containing protein [Bacillus sp. mrc49]|uniref:DUF418 domain-containing protein n=1 Tax=Bacillus sp. mrc49 TaxID=2054913 RepID=UPI000C2776F4|nr:DUF418 domain-containing protein [Bacillus sp. mrc49]PJN90676.1 hypothetical protein CVN76_09160 [Bacillus sp. mrc49]
MKRIRLLDILRGFAIIGTLGTNIWFFAALTNTQNDYLLGEMMWWSSWDAFISSLFLFFVNGKLLSMLTIMFGIGLEIKRQQALRRDWEWPGIYIWGSVLLFLDGILHYVFVIEADVLMSYGITAIIVAFIAKLPQKKMLRWLYVMGTIHILNVTALTMAVSLSPDDFSMSLSSPVYPTGTWAEQWIYRLDHFWLLRAEAIFIIPQNICLFIIGILLMRNKVFTVDTGIVINIRKKFIAFGFIAVPLNLLSFLPYEAALFPVRYIFAPIMALFYMGVIAWLLDKYKKLRLFNSFEAIGKMALSNYMLQNVIASVVFYGWGLGLGLYKLNALSIIAIWFAISVVMVIFSHVWLRYFSTGPFEWAWKWLTNFPRKRSRAS